MKETAAAAKEAAPGTAQESASGAGAAAEAGQAPDNWGAAWNRFWFLPADPLPLGALRVVAGLGAVWFFLSHALDAAAWMGPGGLLSADTAAYLAGVESQAVWRSFRLSPLYAAGSPWVLWTVVALGAASSLLLAAGVWTRAANVAALLLVLTLVHRAAPVAGAAELVLVMLLLYLCLGPAGAALSWRRPRAAAEPSISARIALRLTQVHLSALYLAIGLNQLASEVWWNGEAVWWLIARSDLRVLDLTMVHGVPLLFQAATHLAVAYVLLTGTLIWNRRCRGPLLAAGWLYWPLIGLLTGQLLYAALMLGAGLAFVSPQSIRSKLKLAG